MSRSLFTAVTLAFFFACSGSQQEIPQTDAGASQANVRVIIRSSNTTGNLPAFTASLTEALLNPVAQYPEGTYNNRVFGCCSPRHLGFDFKAPAGTMVKALAPGVVLPSPISGPHCNYGNVVAIWSRLLNGEDFVTVYGHLSGRATSAPTLSGTVHRDTTIGFVASSGGTSPSGPRCGTDDENGDGEEHVHIAIRMGPPPVDAYGNMIWAYYGYAGNGEDVDIDASGVRHDGNFTSVKEFANCHGTHAGAKPDLTLVSGASNQIARSYCDNGGYAALGDSMNAGYGNGLSDWSGVWCQNFKRANQPTATSTALCMDRSQLHGDVLLRPVWNVYANIGAGSVLGAPLENTVTVINPDGFEQRFEHGKISVRGGTHRAELTDGRTFEVNGDVVTLIRTEPQPPSSTGTSSGSASSGVMPISSSSSGNNGTPSSSSSARFSSSSSSSSSSSAGGEPSRASSASPSSSTASSRSSSSSAAPNPNDVDPPYNTCGRFGFNIVVNGDFNLDPLACGWMLEDHLGTARVQQIVVLPGPDPKAIVGTSTASDPWSVQLKQYVPMYQGQRYKFHFRVKTNVADHLIVQIMDDESPWANYGLWMTLNTPGGLEQEFSTTFHATKSHSNARLTFQMGQSTNSFTFDKVWLEAIPEDVP